ncbi:MAG TPA: glycosyltransferase family 4 protein, partial [Myxococcales bacterium]|nr:glycosyltransferase family 4 protein [Myxococcales bacterium]
VTGDATGQAAVNLRWLLRRLGAHGELYSADVSPDLHALVRPISHLRPRPEDLVLYHHGIASWLSGHWMHLRCRKGIVFHNITPARLAAGTPLEEPLISGRAQLAAMAPHADVAIGVSELNALELREAGYRSVHVVPNVVEPERFGPAWADARMARRLARPEGVTVVSVGRVVPSKRVEDLLSLHAELLRLDDRARLLLVGGYDAGSRYVRGLRQTMRHLRGVELLGRVSHAELVAAYRAADVYVSMSEHEGFGVPLVEAMAAELPVLAYGAAAVPETLGGAGIAFDEKRYAALAELVRAVATDPRLRTDLLHGQARRLRQLAPQAVQSSLAAALRPFLPEGPARTARPRPRQRPRRRPPPRVAFVVQRYGEVTGGAELLARMIATRLAKDWRITVLTTCAKDHLAWENDFPEGESRDGALRVLRFPTIRGRRIRRFNAISRRVLGRPNDRGTEERWIAEQGPLSPALLRHLADARERGEYDGYVAFTYLYSTTAWGLPLVARRALLVPTAHDEAPLDLEVYRDIFRLPRALLCSTPEELALIDRRFPGHAPAQVVGVGVDRPPARPERFRKKHGLGERPYLMYVGRVEQGKGVGELLEHHAGLVRRFHDAPELVLAGTASMRVEGERVRALGRIGEQDKHDGLAGALAAVVPSRYESLSLLALEAFAQGTPVLANGRSDVLAGQVRRSEAGRTYDGAESFAEGVREIGQSRAAMSRKAAAYARGHRWDRVLDAYREQMDRIISEPEPKAEARR